MRLDIPSIEITPKLEHKSSAASDYEVFLNEMNDKMENLVKVK